MIVPITERKSEHKTPLPHKSNVELKTGSVFANKLHENENERLKQQKKLQPRKQHRVVQSLPQRRPNLPAGTPFA
jgi:hypothetical protein